MIDDSTNGPQIPLADLDYPGCGLETLPIMYINFMVPIGDVIRL